MSSSRDHPDLRSASSSRLSVVLPLLSGYAYSSGSKLERVMIHCSHGLISSVAVLLREAGYPSPHLLGRRLRLAAVLRAGLPAIAGGMPFRSGGHPGRCHVYVTFGGADVRGAAPLVPG